MSLDIPYDWCLKIAQSFYKEKYTILFVTARFDNYWEETTNWLNKYFIDYKLFMRGTIDFRSDDMVKKDIYVEHISSFYEVLFSIEDRSSVVKMWRELGVICLQCARGDY